MSLRLQAQECGWITSRQIEASRRAMTRYVKRGGKIWIRIFPDKPVTMRAAETRMGSGKGNPEFWVAVIKPGRILFEMGGEEITPKSQREAMRLAQYKLPVKTKFIALDDEEQKAGAKARLLLSRHRGVLTMARPTPARCATCPMRISAKRSTVYAANLFELRFEQATRQLGNTHRFKEVRIKLAQLLTVQSERQALHRLLIPISNHGS